jgi:hypothetical protein
MPVGQIGHCLLAFFAALFDILLTHGGFLCMSGYFINAWRILSGPAHKM